MASGFPNEAQKSKVKGWQWSLAMVFGNVHPRIGSIMFVQGQRSAMFLWQCSSKVVAMFLLLDAFLLSLCDKEGSADGTAALTARL